MAKNRLREIRHELMLDEQKQMAELLGINQAQYHRYERHKTEPTLDIALRIAKKLSRKVDDIFYLDDDDPIG